MPGGDGLGSTKPGRFMAENRMPLPHGGDGSEEPAGTLEERVRRDERLRSAQADTLKVSPNAKMYINIRPKPAPVQEDLPTWLSEKSKREISGINRPLAQGLLAAAEATGQHFRVTQGLRTPREASDNAKSGKGVRNSQHLWGAAADIVMIDEKGQDIPGRKAYEAFAEVFEAYSRAHGGHARWLGNLTGRWRRDIVHFDQGIGYGETHAPDPFGVDRPTQDDIDKGNQEAFTSPDNPLLRRPKLRPILSPTGGNSPKGDEGPREPLPQENGVPAAVKPGGRLGPMGASPPWPTGNLDERRLRALRQSLPLPSEARLPTPYGALSQMHHNPFLDLPPALRGVDALSPAPNDRQERKDTGPVLADVAGPSAASGRARELTGAARVQSTKPAQAVNRR